MRRQGSWKGGGCVWGVRVRRGGGFGRRYLLGWRKGKVVVLGGEELGGREVFSLVI